MLGKSLKNILIAREALLKRMTQTYMSCVFSALRYVVNALYVSCSDIRVKIIVNLKTYIRRISFTKVLKILMKWHKTV